MIDGRETTGERLYWQCEVTEIVAGNDRVITVVHSPTGLRVVGKSDLSRAILLKNLLRRLQALIDANPKKSS